MFFVRFFSPLSCLADTFIWSNVYSSLLNMIICRILSCCLQWSTLCVNLTIIQTKSQLLQEITLTEIIYLFML